MTMLIMFTVVLEYPDSDEQYRWAGPASSPDNALERALAQAQADNEDPDMGFRMLLVCPGEIAPYLYGPADILPKEISVIEKQFDTAVELFNKSFGRTV
jgi:hypothetical protein